MKKLVFILLLAPFAAYAQPSASAIFKALGSGDATALSAYMDSSVEITLLDMEDYLDKAEATQVLKKFFAKYKPTGFDAMHEGQSKAGGLHYSIGELKTVQSTYRVYLLLGTVGNRYVIQQIRITRE